MERILKKLPEPLLAWYRQNKRDLPWRKNTDPYRVWISEIMLQQTRVEAVIGYYDRFLKTFPDVASLANADEDKLLKCWEGLGYYSRARNLKKAANEIIQNHGGVFPSDFESIRKLTGIGPYTAGAISSICFSLKKAAVDGNVLRIVSRITNSFKPIDAPQTKKEITESLEKIYPASAGDFTQSLMELGATVCIPKSPKCESCPVSDLCQSRKENTQKLLPVKSPKKDKKIQKKTVFLLKCGEKYALCQREKTGLLASLWQFPNTDKHLSVTDAVSFAESMGTKPYEVVSRVEKQHIFTHIRWEMIGYTLLCRKMPDTFQWADEQEIESTYALPTAFRQFIEE
ncbi:MAG: A/G-specific adenine glycosylase [Clostridia bacterium]|nr:A/G-specific adenine glycosylase [Clostridia bacterium]